MNKFELYTMIFMALDHYWDDHKNDELGMFLSSMNPFLFTNIGSAVPYVYHDYEKWIEGKNISVENSFNIANEYIAFLNEDYITVAFAWVTIEDWNEKCIAYLSEPHKGQDYFIRT